MNRFTKMDVFAIAVSLGLSVMSACFMQLPVDGCANWWPLHSFCIWFGITFAWNVIEGVVFFSHRRDRIKREWASCLK